MEIEALRLYLQEKMFELLELYYILPMHNFEVTARVMDYGHQIIAELILDGRLKGMSMSDRTLLIAEVSIEIRKMQKGVHPDLV